MKSIYLLLLLLSSLGLYAQVDLLKNTNDLEPVNVDLTSTEHKKKNAIRMVQKQGSQGETLAILKTSDFKNGTIEVEVAGSPRVGADTTARGFIGIAFRVKAADTIQYDCFYIRPTNGRSSDQLRRNHATQYISHPDFPWFRLRKESPGVYESYVDLVPAEWTKIKIVVDGQRAKLFVHESSQPSLVVSDLKRGAAAGQIALWIDGGTEGYFRNLKVTPR